MEIQKSAEQPLIRKLLGSSREVGSEAGIINEYEAFIQRRAYDYLMIGFATDVDQVEADKEARHEQYINKIEADFAQYREDAMQWNMDHIIDADEKACQKERFWDDQTHQYVTTNIRRTDLPPAEVLKNVIITNPAAFQIPSREDLKQVASESFDTYYDIALSDAYVLLKSRLSDIAAEIPIAPHESDESGLLTRSELIEEYRKIVSRMSAIEELIIERNPLDAADNLAILQPQVSLEVSPTTAQTYVVRSLGKTGTALVRAE